MISRTDILQMAQVLKARERASLSGCARIHQRIARWWKSFKAKKKENPAKPNP
jgi:hypothetical protein